MYAVMEVVENPAGSGNYSDAVIGGFSTGDFHCFSDGRHQSTSRVGVRAVAQDQIQQNHCCLGISRFLHDPIIAEPEVEHRVGPSNRELVFTEVDADVPGADVVVLELHLLVDRCVGRDIAHEFTKEEERFVAEGSSGENTAYRLAMGWQALTGVL